MIVIIDYGMGNLKSIQKAFERLEIESKISADLAEIKQASKLILPGVGHFAQAMQHIHKMNLLEVLNEKVLQQKTPILGICLGMQLLCNFSEEGDVEGLSWLNAKTVRFRVQDKIKYKIPHIGWNSIKIQKDNPLFAGLGESGLFYFVHSYHVVCEDQSDVLSSSLYDYNFTSAVQRDNIYGTQFHPEKSRKIGMRILKNFAAA